MIGEDERFREVYESNYSLLKRVARNRGLPEYELEDMVQETFTNYYAHYPLTLPDLHVRMILVRIIRNLCVDYFRKRGSASVDTYDTDTLENLLIYGAGKTAEDTLDVVMGNILYDDIIDGLRAMKPIFRKAFVMYVIQGKTMDEISETEGVSKAACRMRLMRARRFLKAYLKTHSRLGGADEHMPAIGKPGFEGPSDEQ